MYLYSTQIKGKSNLKLVFITFPVLDSELSSAGKRMWEKKHQDIWKKCLCKMPLTLVTFGHLLCIGSTSCGEAHLIHAENPVLLLWPLSTFIAINSPNHKLTRDLFAVFHSGRRSDIRCPFVVSDASNASAFFYGLTTRICYVPVSVLTQRFHTLLLGVQNLYRTAVVVQHRGMSTDLTMAQSEGIWE